MTPELKHAVLKDFQQWTGGFTPDECDFNQIHNYVECSLPNEFIGHKERIRAFLKGRLKPFQVTLILPPAPEAFIPRCDVYFEILSFTPEEAAYEVFAYCQDRPGVGCRSAMAGDVIKVDDHWFIMKGNGLEESTEADAKRWMDMTFAERALLSIGIDPAGIITGEVMSRKGQNYWKETPDKEVVVGDVSLKWFREAGVVQIGRIVPHLGRPGSLTAIHLDGLNPDERKRLIGFLTEAVEAEEARVTKS